MATPVARPSFYDETVVSSPEMIDGQRIALHAERLGVAKRRIADRVARVTRRAVTVRQTFEVDVRHEELVVEYVDGDGSPMLEEGGETIVVVLRAEEVEIVKHLRPVEEVRLSKRSVLTTERVSDTVRHERLDVVETPG